MTVTERYLHYLATQIDCYGLRSLESEIAAVADDARRAGISPVALSVLADPAEPEIARARAFGIVATRLVREGERATEAPLVATAALPHREQTLIG